MSQRYTPYMLNKPFLNIFLLAFIVLITSACGGDASTDITSDQSTGQTIIGQEFSHISLAQPGRYDAHLSLESSSSAVEYGLYVPVIEPNEQVPLVLALHFSGGRGPSFLGNTVMPALQELDAIIISPTVTNGSSWTSQSSSDKLKEILDLALLNWPIDPKKVVVMGYSMGGSGSWNLASLYPELFSAAIPMAASAQIWTESLTDKVQYYVIHPELDTGASVAEMETQIQSLQDKGVDAQLIIATGAGHFDVDRSISYLYEAIDWLKYTVWQEQ